MSLAQEPAVSGSRPAGEHEGARPPKSRFSFMGAVEAYAMLGLLVVVAIFFCFYGPTSETFPTAANIQNLVSGQAVVAIIALAALIPLTCNEWDLSVGATAGMASIFAATALANGVSILVFILIGVSLGLLVGIVNALIVTRLRVNAVITTLGVATILDGVVNQKTQGLAVAGNIPVAVTDFGSLNWFGIPRPAFALLLITLLVYYVTTHTPVGRYLYALGSNPRGAKLVGLRTRLLLGGTFIAAGALSGAAGTLQVALSGGADPRLGENFTLPALAAAFLSAAAIKPGRYNVGGTLVAIFFLATINNGLNLAGAAPYVGLYVNGAALIIGVGLAANLARKRTGEG